MSGVRYQEITRIEKLVSQVNGELRFGICLLVRRWKGSTKEEG